MKSKISIIGAGQVGGTAAYMLMRMNLGDIVLLDVVDGVPQGKALDIMQSGAVIGHDCGIKGTNDYKDIISSDIVFITAGLARKPGMDRLDLLKKNVEIIDGIIKNIKEYCPESIVIVMTNPVDVLSYYAWKVSGFKSNKVIGQAGVLDTARFKYFISAELNVPYDSVETVVLGGHGDTMVPLPRLTKVKGKLLPELLPEDKVKYLIDKARNGGAEIVNLLKTGSAYYAPAMSAAVMIESILKDKKSVMPVSVYLNGEYGIKDVYIGVPVVLGRNGIEKIVDLGLTKEELSALHKSAEIYKASIREILLQ